MGTICSMETAQRFQYQAVSKVRITRLVANAKVSTYWSKVYAISSLCILEIAAIPLVVTCLVLSTTFRSAIVRFVIDIILATIWRDSTSAMRTLILSWVSSKWSRIVVNTKIRNVFSVYKGSSWTLLMDPMCVQDRFVIMFWWHKWLRRKSIMSATRPCLKKTFAYQIRMICAKSSLQTCLLIPYRTYVSIARTPNSGSLIWLIRVTAISGSGKSGRLRLPSSILWVSVLI